MLMLVLLMSMIDPARIYDMPAAHKTSTSPSYTGYAAHYAPGIMTRVARIRGMKPVDCMVSSPTKPLNTWLHVTSLKNGYTRLCRVTDISAPKDRPRHIKQNLAIEFDFDSAQVMCDIQYVSQEPPRACPVRVYEVKTSR